MTINKGSWFNRVKAGAVNHGISIKGVVHKASPIAEGNGWKKGICPKCGSNNGFVFRSHMDGKIYILFCQKCGKYSWAKAKGTKGQSNPPDMNPKCTAITKRGNRCDKDATCGDLCGTHHKMQEEGKQVTKVSIPSDVY